MVGWGQKISRYTLGLRFPPQGSSLEVSLKEQAQNWKLCLPEMPHRGERWEQHRVYPMRFFEREMKRRHQAEQKAARRLKKPRLCRQFWIHFVPVVCVVYVCLPLLYPFFTAAAVHHF